MTFNQFVSKLDRLASEVVKKLNHYTCEICKRKFEYNSKNLSCSHFVNRRHMGCRWDINNLDCLCISCHSIFEYKKKNDYRDFKIKKNGLEVVESLEKNKYQVADLSLSDLEQTYEKLKSYK